MKKRKKKQYTNGGDVMGVASSALSAIPGWGQAANMTLQMVGAAYKNLIAKQGRFNIPDTKTPYGNLTNGGQLNHPGGIPTYMLDSNYHKNIPPDTTPNKIYPIPKDTTPNKIPIPYYFKQQNGKKVSISSDEYYNILKNASSVKTLEHGGNLTTSDNDRVIEYNAPSHQNGGQLIDKNMLPTTTNGIANIEKEETSFNGYVYSDSDKLLNKNGKTFAKNSKMIKKKYGGENSLDKTTKKYLLNILKDRNTAARIEAEQAEQSNASKEYTYGGDPLFDRYLNSLGPNPLPSYSNNPIADNDPLKLKGRYKSLNYNYTPVANFANVPPLTQRPNTIDPSFSTDTIDPLSTTPTLPQKTTDPFLETNDPLKVQNFTGFKFKESPLNQSKIPKSYLNPALIGKGIELFGKGAMLAKGYDKVDPNYNPYENEISDLMENRQIDYQALVNEALLSRNAALKTNQNARSLNVKRALDAGSFNAYSRVAANLKLQEQQANNQYRAEEASTKNNLGQQRASAETLAEDLEARNKGAYLNNAGSFLESIGNAGAFGTKVKVNDMQSQEGMAVINEMYENFVIDQDAYYRIVNGNPTQEDFIKFRDYFNKNR